MKPRLFITELNFFMLYLARLVADISFSHLMTLKSPPNIQFSEHVLLRLEISSRNLFLSFILACPYIIMTHQLKPLDIKTLAKIENSFPNELVTVCRRSSHMRMMPSHLPLAFREIYFILIELQIDLMIFLEMFCILVSVRRTKSGQ